MTNDNYTNNLKALLAFEVFRTPARMTRALLDHTAMGDAWRDSNRTTRGALEAQANELSRRGIRAITAGDDIFPARLQANGRPRVPTLFCRGPLELLGHPSLAVAGSRKATENGMASARMAAAEATNLGMPVVSGYAQGIDREAHLAALQTGGTTILVLAEGINRFRPNKQIADGYADDRVLVVSQFHPDQIWAAYTAMSRNSVIVGLSRALVVIEAGEKGGTLAAGRVGIKSERPVIALDGDDPTPGNKMLIAEGAVHARSPEALAAELQRRRQTPVQETLPFD